MHHRATLVLMSIASLKEDFFYLKARLAGEVIQKFVTYHSRLAILGDISR